MTLPSSPEEHGLIRALRLDLARAKARVAELERENMLLKEHYKDALLPEDLTPDAKT